jgi:hypothetical protein
MQSRSRRGSPYAFTPAVQVYGFVQVPIYRYVNGVQLTADWSGTVGDQRAVLKIVTPAATTRSRNLRKAATS